MNLNLNKFKKELLFLPLGGSGEIGLNCNLYHYDGKWLIVDMGIGFTNEIPGIDVVAPDISFIKEHLKDCLGILLTHIHEDHIGAVQYLWEELKLPIYTSKFTSTFLKERLSEYEFGEQVKIIEIQEGKTLNLKPFELEFIGLTHSTPEMNAILIKTEVGNILHTGDWKFEEKPVIGNVSDKKKLKDLGSKGEILAAVCESTNVFKTEKVKTEAELLKNLKNIMKENDKGLIVCAIFASNIARIISLSLAAKACGRKIGVIGRSIYRILKVANEMNYIPKGLEFIAEDDLGQYNKKELMIISTGCQGEPTSGLNKLATDTHRTVHLASGDTVIFSSSVIPGNEKNIYAVYNKLSEKDVKIVTDQNEFVHLSGHYNRDDLIEMYKLIKPKIVIATHGEEMHLAEHKRIATECGIKQVLKAKDGVLLKINENKSEILEKLDLVNVAIDGRRMLPLNSHIIGERKKISESGAIIVVLVVDRGYKLREMPSITTIGNYDLKHEKDMKDILEEDITKTYNGALNRMINQEDFRHFEKDEDKELYLDKEIRKTVNHIFQLDMGKKPCIIIKICKLNV
ncbi:MAG TPA: ribonuclease J [Rickettsiales bacterium]|nr:ribonuclease J [Rickettsiales bacterium]